MDAWSHTQVLAMLEGGNDQLKLFYARHNMGNDSAAASERYHTKAAKFYRVHLDQHVEKVAVSGVYKGRHASRPRPKQKNQKPRQKQNDSNMLPRVDSSQGISVLC
jgi:hypothetical protein